MANINYKRSVRVSSELIDCGFDEDNHIIDGTKITAGAPVTTAGWFIPGCEIQNSNDGEVYRNAGTLASPSWSTE